MGNAAAPSIQAVERTLECLEFVKRIGVGTVASLAKQPGWDKASASRYLRLLAERGYFERLSDKGQPRYVLGRKLLELGGGFTI